MSMKTGSSAGHHLPAYKCRHTATQPGSHLKHISRMRTPAHAAAQYGASARRRNGERGEMKDGPESLNEELKSGKVQRDEMLTGMC